MSRPPLRRCAIYTRKSSEEGLEQDFNSLHAQREACEAFIKSQAHEGWRALPTLYDDGGISGGTMERPALRRLLENIRLGLVDIVVVYKVDRLTRSLADFAKMVEIMEGGNASFVSVTQQFNTTSSMGRLTLNVLLSFAQFEREVTGERIRDKVAASRRKGIWMGGVPPLGYDVGVRRLVINEAEGEQVRLIFERYCELRSVNRLLADLRHRGIRSKRWTSRTGATRGGNDFGRGALNALLQNRVYIGEAVHKGKAYPGEHPAIVPRPLWDAVQSIIEQNGVEMRDLQRSGGSSLLCGLLYDDRGNRMMPSFATKKGKRYRYYVSRALIEGRPGDAGPLSRVPAQAIEDIVRCEAQKRNPEPAQHEHEPTLVRKSVSRVVVCAEALTIMWKLPADKDELATGGLDDTGGVAFTTVPFVRVWSRRSRSLQTSHPQATVRFDRTLRSRCEISTASC